MEASPAQAADTQICMQVLNSVIHNITICQPNSSAAPVINVSAADVPSIRAEESCVNAPPEFAMDENEVRFGTWLFRAFFVFWLWHCNACIKWGHSCEYAIFLQVATAPILPTATVQHDHVAVNASSPAAATLARKRARLCYLFTGQKRLYDGLHFDAADFLEWHENTSSCSDNFCFCAALTRLRFGGCRRLQQW